MSSIMSAPVTAPVASSEVKRTVYFAELVKPLRFNSLPENPYPVPVCVTEDPAVRPKEGKARKNVIIIADNIFFMMDLVRGGAGEREKMAPPAPLGD
jgi:hypothetical protein